MTRKSKKVFLLVLILLLIFLFIFSRRALSPNKTALSNVTPTPAPSQVSESTTKCQNVVVSAGETVELFTYQSGQFIRFDYRVAATTEEKALNLQVLSDGQWFYVWDDVDPVFKVPADFTFEDSNETSQKIKEDLAKICQVCAKTSNATAASACRTNLSCL